MKINRLDSDQADSARRGLAKRDLNCRSILPGGKHLNCTAISASLAQLVVGARGNLLCDLPPLCSQRTSTGVTSGGSYQASQCWHARSRSRCAALKAALVPTGCRWSTSEFLQ